MVNDGEVSEQNPRYRLPGKRVRAGKVLEFRKTRFLYNGYRFKTAVEDLIVVEGFVSVWWFHQSSLSQTVATMGSDGSDRQAELIVSLVKPQGRIWLVPDGNEAGERLAQSLLHQLSPSRFVRWVKLENGKQPTDLPSNNLESLFRI